jgi:hypothetical protein
MQMFYAAIVCVVDVPVKEACRFRRAIMPNSSSSGHRKAALEVGFELTEELPPTHALEACALGH